MIRRSASLATVFCPTPELVLGACATARSRAAATDPAVFDPHRPPAGPKYFVLLRWSADKIAGICDFRCAPYITDGAEDLV